MTRRTLYRRLSSEPTILWLHAATLAHDGGTDYYDGAVSLSGDRAAVASDVSGYRLYRRTDSGWIETQELGVDAPHALNQLHLGFA